MRRAVISAVIMLFLAACNDTPPYQSTYMELSTAQVDKVTASVNETVEVTVRGRFGVDDTDNAETFTTPGVNLGACVSYASDPATEGGLCPGGERPLPNGLSMVGTSITAKDFGNFTISPGESRSVEHTFSFTSDRTGVFRLVPAYLFRYENGASPGYEPGPYSILQIIFE